LSARVVAIASIVFVILAVTLKPSGSGPTAAFSLALGEGHRWLADGILNLLLFFPLGAALSWNGRSPTRAIVVGFLLSTMVELAQVWIPGRDPSLSDIVFNTAGSALGGFAGLHSRVWVNPRGRASVRLTTAATAGALLVLVLTAVLLAPANDAFSTYRSGDDLILEYTARSTAIGLDQPVFWIPGAFQAGIESGPVTTHREGGKWIVSTAPGRRETLGPTPGEGWALLAFSETRARTWGPLLGGVWMLCLGAVVGFLARGRLALVAALVVGLALVSIPVVAGIKTTTGPEWIGIVIGFITGAVLCAVAGRILTSSVDDPVSRLQR
jgi:hypothetical protein